MIYAEIRPTSFLFVDAAAVNTECRTFDYRKLELLFFDRRREVLEEATLFDFRDAA
jgi:hypothetical protein